MFQSFYAAENKLYFEWLISLVGGEKWWAGKEKILARLLERKYYWNNELDENMAGHALELRTKCMVETNIPTFMIPGGQATVLEVLISLAMRIDGSIMYNPDYKPRVAQFFAELMGILGFDEMDETQIDWRIDQFLDGKAKIFDMECGMEHNNPSIWEQVNAYYSPLFDLENE